MLHFRNSGLIVFLFFSTFCFSQSKKLDSLHQVLAGYPREDTVRVRLIYEIVRREFFSNPGNALRLAKEALEISKKIGYTKGMMRSYALIGNFYHSVGDIDKVAECGMKMVELSESYGQKKSLGAYGYTLLGFAHSEWGNYRKAISYHKKFLEALLTQPDQWIQIVEAYNNLGVNYLSLKNYDSSIYYHSKALKINLEKNNLPGASSNYLNLATNHFLMGDNQAALANYYEGLRLAKKMSAAYGPSSGHGDDEIVSFVHLGLADVYAKEGQYEKALQYADSSLTFAKENNHYVRLRDSYLVLSDVEKKRKNFEKALAYHELHVAFRDSVFSQDKLEEINNLEARYDVEQKEQAILLLDRDKRIANLWRNIAFAGSAVIILISVVTIMLLRYREKKKREVFNLRIDFLLNENKELSEKYKIVAIDSVKSALESHDQRILKNALEIVESNMSDPLFGVEKLADEIGMSRASLHRKLKAITGFPPSDLIRSIRLRRAAAMLRNQSDNVSRIGFSVGFEDQSYFTKSFKKQFGVTPTDFVKSEKLVVKPT